MRINAEMQMVVYIYTCNLINNKINNQKDGSIMPVSDTG